MKNKIKKSPIYLVILSLAYLINMFSNESIKDNNSDDSMIKQYKKLPSSAVLNESNTFASNEVHFDSLINNIEDFDETKDLGEEYLIVEPISFGHIFQKKVLHHHNLLNLKLLKIFTHKMKPNLLIYNSFLKKTNILLLMLN